MVARCGRGGEVWGRGWWGPLSRILGGGLPGEMPLIFEFLGGGLPSETRVAWCWAPGRLVPFLAVEVAQFLGSVVLLRATQGS